jgi:SAM-dependent methyltransferase
MANHAPSETSTSTTVPGTRPACYLCGTGDPKLLVELDRYNVLRCVNCSFVYSDFPADQAASLYDEHYFHEDFGPYFAESFGEVENGPLRKKFEEYAGVLAEFSPPPGELLDVGCAAGLFLDVARERGWNVQGLELSPHAVKVAREHFGLTVHEGDFAAVDLEEGSFDAITLLDVLEHLYEPSESLQRIKALLRPGGILMVVLPNDRNLTTMVSRGAYHATRGRVSYPASRVHQIYHPCYYTPKTLTGLLRREGFEILAVRPDETLRELLNEPAYVRAAVSVLFGVSRLLKLQNKMLVVARRPGGAA